MIVKITPKLGDRQQVLSVDSLTGEIILRIPDNDYGNLSAWIQSIPANTLEEMEEARTKQGKWLTVNSRGTLSIHAD